jgi:hypothetical protein
MSQSVPGGMVVGTLIHVLLVLSSDIRLETFNRLCGFTHSIQVNDWENTLKSAVITLFSSFHNSHFVLFLFIQLVDYFLNKPRSNIWRMYMFHWLHF